MENSFPRYQSSNKYSLSNLTKSNTKNDTININIEKKIIQYFCDLYNINVRWTRTLEACDRVNHSTLNRTLHLLSNVHDFSKTALRSLFSVELNERLLRRSKRVCVAKPFHYALYALKHSLCSETAIDFEQKDCEFVPLTQKVPRLLA